MELYNDSVLDAACIGYLTAQTVVRYVQEILSAGHFSGEAHAIGLSNMLRSGLLQVKSVAFFVTVRSVKREHLGSFV